MAQVYSFPPIECSGSIVLILGTMPGEASLRLQQYYGHARNCFWKIVGDVLRFDAQGSYEERKSALQEHKVALWDVLASCRREGSLDSRIDSASIVLNDFATFFAQHPHIHRVCFNGAKAESLYRKHVLPCLAHDWRSIYVRLPSTSPAHAAMAYAAKVRAWMVISEEAEWMAEQSYRPEQ